MDVAVDTQAIATSALGLFDEALAWLRATYATHRFYVERDVVWTVQKWLQTEVAARGLPLRVFNDYGIEPGSRRSLSADLALVNAASRPVLLVEFKYEPSHRRTDIPSKKFPVVDWRHGVLADVERVRRWVTMDLAPAAIALLIDEGGTMRHREASDLGRWLDWGAVGDPTLKVSIYRTQIVQADVRSSRP